MQNQTKLQFLVMTLAVLVTLCASPVEAAEKVTIRERQFTIPDGFHLESAVQHGLTERPIVVDFDDQGNLYVAESSGTNDNVQKQLEDKPHSILRLTDSDNDGRFDQRTVFADRMMFPEGTLWHAGSLYVAAPPQIWKLTDTDGDGVCDEREVWFDAKTLTGCANDLHGPYLGPDGWIYWCKGAFAEQTYERPDAAPFVTSAAHIFRRRPEGGPIEPVMTGGMDNPVEVAFSETGERFFTTTFFQHPANGRRDGVVHAIYGGVYGKQHGVIDGHPRTGELMPVMTHLGAAAPSGLTRLESTSLGLRNQLVSACFNLHSVQLHQLVPAGSTFTTVDTDLVASDNLDFHPTDVIEDADGSLLIVDTGGWYKLCCPTSQLHKPDVLGAIYRLRKKAMPEVDDARGNSLKWAGTSAADLVDRLADPRFAVRRRAVQWLGEQGPAAVSSLANMSTDAESTEARLNAVWAACRMENAAARVMIRASLSDRDPRIRTAATHAVSVWRDTDATNNLLAILTDEVPAVRRAAAEALGRVGNASSVSHLVSALDGAPDRTLRHSLTYALIEIGAVDATRMALGSDSHAAILGALRALHGMPGGELRKAEICRFLASDDSEIRNVATSIAAERPEWGASYAATLRPLANRSGIAIQVSRLGNSSAVRRLVLDWLASNTTTDQFKTELVQQIRLPDFARNEFNAVIGRLLSANDQELKAAVVKKLTESKGKLANDHRRHLQAIARSSQAEAATRLASIRCLKEVESDLLDYAVSQLTQTDSVNIRGLAATAVGDLELTILQLLSLADAVQAVGPLELGRVIAVFESQTDQDIGQRLIAALVRNPAASALPSDRIIKLANQFGADVVELAQPLLQLAEVTPEAKAKHLDQLLAEMPPGDVRNGQRVFHSSKAACFACHAVGYLGGTVGPDLSRIARIRSRRDMLEAIVYPSASFVRSYEPVNVVTSDGKQLIGTIRNQTAREVVLQLNATEQQTVSTSEIESMLPSMVSIMPAGLEQQLSLQDLADLLVFLESRK